MSKNKYQFTSTEIIIFLRDFSLENEYAINVRRKTQYHISQLK